MLLLDHLVEPFVHSSFPLPPRGGTTSRERVITSNNLLYAPVNDGLLHRNTEHFPFNLYWLFKQGNPAAKLPDSRLVRVGDMQILQVVDKIFFLAHKVVGLHRIQNVDGLEVVEAVILCFQEGEYVSGGSIRGAVLLQVDPAFVDEPLGSFLDFHIFYME